MNNTHNKHKILITLFVVHVVILVGCAKQQSDEEFTTLGEIRDDVIIEDAMKPDREIDYPGADIGREAPETTEPRERPEPPAQPERRDPVEPPEPQEPVEPTEPVETPEDADSQEDVEIPEDSDSTEQDAPSENREVPPDENTPIEVTDPETGESEDIYVGDDMSDRDLEDIEEEIERHKPPLPDDDPTEDQEADDDEGNGTEETELPEKEATWRLQLNDVDDVQTREFVYVIKKNDTLWDISEKLLKDPFVWKAIWNRNGYIQNPHLIYPDNKISIKFKRVK